MEMKKLDKNSAAVFTNLLKEESYAHFEARSVLLGKKGTGKTTVTRTTHGGEKTRQTICSCVHKTTKRRKLRPL
jgi:ABC-type branched-subunit amino acid transport system ATPase component